MGEAWISYANNVDVEPGETADTPAFREFAHQTVPPGSYVFVAKGVAGTRAGETTVWVRLQARPREGDETAVTIVDGFAPFTLAGIVSLEHHTRIQVECWTTDWPVNIDYFRLVMMQVDALHWPP